MVVPYVFTDTSGHGDVRNLGIPEEEIDAIFHPFTKVLDHVARDPHSA